MFRWSIYISWDPHVTSDDIHYHGPIQTSLNCTLDLGVEWKWWIGNNRHLRGPDKLF